jgi:DNA polymerase-3 subunit delta
MPQIELQKLLTRLTEGKPVAGILLVGDDSYLREATRKKLIEAVVPEGAREWGVSRFSLGEDDLGRVLQQAQTLPMLAPRQVVFVEQLEELEKLEDKAREKAVKAIETYLGDPAPFTLLVFEAIKLDDRMRLSKMLGEKALVVEAAVPGDGEARIQIVADIVQKMAGELGAEIDGEAAADLADLVNGELARARTELEKLAAYVGERRRITPADVDLLVVSEKKYSIWELVDMLASRKRDRALEFLSSVLREGEGPPAIVGALAWMYRKLIHAQDLPRGASKWDAMRQLGMREKTAEMALAQSRRISRTQLLAGLRALYDADSRLKSGTAEPRAVLEFLIGQLTAPPVQPGTVAAASR